jgi:phage tail tape-measure protein
MTKKIKIIVPVLLMLCLLCTSCGKVIVKGVDTARRLDTIRRTPDKLQFAIEPTTENAVGLVGDAAGSCAGGAAGAYVGAGVGTAICPGFGTAIGSGVGYVGGSAIGGYVGEKSARTAYRMYDSDSKDESEEPAQPE